LSKIVQNFIEKLFRPKSSFIKSVPGEDGAVEELDAGDYEHQNDGPDEETETG
jgi:hypothetical protein